VPLWYGGPACGLHSCQERPRARSAGTSRRALDRCGGPPGLSARAADARTAHPPGEGDLQHLQRPRSCWRSLPRCTRSTPVPKGCGGIARQVHRARLTWRRAARFPASACCIGSSSDTVVVVAPGRAAAIVDDARERGVLLRTRRRGSRRDLVRLRRPHLRTSQRVLEAFGACDGGVGADTALPDTLLRRGPILGHPVFSEHTPRRRCCATCAGCRPGLRARSGHDPLGVVHHEA